MTALGWHFVGETLRDGSPIPRDGRWLDYVGPIEICRSGLHGSRRPWHALQYAPGPVLCRVEFDGIAAEQSDKLVARRRKILCRADVTTTLRYFASMQALSVSHLWDAPDVVLDYMMTGGERARDAAWDAAMGAARAAAWDAAWDAARGAARAAAWDAAWAAAWDAAWAAARAAAWDAAWAAAGDAAGNDFDALVTEQFGVAA